MRRKRKARVVWLPQDLGNRLGQAPASATLGSQSATGIAVLTANPLGAVTQTQEFAIVKDFGGPANNQGTADPEASLADIEDSGYRLRRIVGKIGVSVLQGNAAAAGDGSIFHVTAGFIIRRIQTASPGQSTALLASSVGTQDQIDVASLDNTMDPWIWRRSWDLADTSAAALALDPNVVSFPPSNYKYGSGIFDGPHVDAKTARVVGPEERLFLDITCEGVNGNGQGNPGAVLVLFDLRVLASMRTSVGNRRNASR